METSEGPAAPASGTAIPAIDELTADPEIAALLDFEPVPRSLVKANGWTPGMQRMFIAWLAWYGSPTKACDELGKARSGVDKLYKAADADQFRAAWDAAIALFERRRIARTVTRHGGAGALRAPTASRSAPAPGQPFSAGPGQVLNEFGEWEDEDSYAGRNEEARDSIANKLRNCRRLFLQEISDSPGKRAAFEILTEFSIDWDKAARLEPQEDEPFRRPNMRQADMVLTSEAGWMGWTAHGRDKVAELRATLDAHRAEEGLDPVEWEEDG